MRYRALSVAKQLRGGKGPRESSLRRWSGMQPVDTRIEMMSLWYGFRTRCRLLADMAAVSMVATGYLSLALLLAVSIITCVGPLTV